MKLTTPINIEPIKYKIEHDHSVLTLGSCFAKNVGAYFQKLKFNSIINPFGVLYNSASIKNSINLTSQKKIFTKEDLIFDQGEYHSFYHHSDFSHHEAEKSVHLINSTFAATYDFLKKTDWMIISLGTSFVYRYKATGLIVSNCHKIPQTKFDKLLLTPEQNYSNLKELIDLQRSINPNTKFIFTVSPVRHIKDGAHNNQVSKSSLILAVNSLVNENDNTFYFPSYEIVMDELRDYRFYDKDLCHPNGQAIEYIWDKFIYSCLSDNCRDVVREIDKVVIAASHRVRNIHSSKNKEFAKKQIERIYELKSKFPYLNFENELQKFNSYLTDN